MENRRILPPLFKGEHSPKLTQALQDRGAGPKASRTNPFALHPDPDKTEDLLDSPANTKRKERQKKAKEATMNRSYTTDEFTCANLLKGHPDAQEILDELNKGRKKNESGEEFKDGSEDTIGGEGHAAVARPGSIKHEGGNPVPGPNDPGVSAKNASMEDGDLEKSEDEEEVEKSDNFTDNEPEEFEDGLVGADDDPDDDGDVLVSKKSLTADEQTIDHLIKTMGAERLEDILKAVIGGRTVDPGQVGKLATENPKNPGNVAGGGPLKGQANPLTDRKVNTSALDALKKKLGTSDSSKSEGEDNDLEKSENNEEEGTDMSQDWSLDFSKSVLTNMGLEKGSPSVSKKVAGGKATQISYSSKPETHFKHPKQKTGETRYEHNVKEGTVTKKEATGEKGKFKEGKAIDVSDEKKLKNASQEGFDLHKALDEILEKKR